MSLPVNGSPLSSAGSEEQVERNGPHVATILTLSLRMAEVAMLDPDRHPALTDHPLQLLQGQVQVNGPLVSVLLVVGVGTRMVVVDPGKAPVVHFDMDILQAILDHAHSHFTGLVTIGEASASPRAGNPSECCGQHVSLASLSLEWVVNGSAAAPRGLDPGRAGARNEVMLLAYFADDRTIGPTIQSTMIPVSITQGSMIQTVNTIRAKTCLRQNIRPAILTR